MKVAIILVGRFVAKWRERRKTILRWQEWRRTRSRAPIIKVGTITETGVEYHLNGWLFFIKAGTCHVSGIDPETQEPICLGYSASELKEIALCPSEWEQPELAQFEP